VIVAVILLQVWLKFPMMEDVYEDTANRFDEMEVMELESNTGKIKSPLSENPLLVNEP